MINKLGHAYWAGQKDYKPEGESNVSVERSDFNWRRMAEIKKEIEATFEPFLYQRENNQFNKNNPKFRVVPEQTFSISDDPESNQNPYTKGASLYFRFNIERRILPQSGEAKEKSESIINEINGILGDTGIDQFVNFCEHNGIPILPFFASSAVTKKVNQTQLISDLVNSTINQTDPNKVIQQPQYRSLNNIKQKITENPKSLHMGYTSDVSMGFSESQIRFNNKADALAKMMIYKMAAGYVLNMEYLGDLLENDYVKFIYNKDENRQYGKPNKRQTEEMILHYEKIFKTLVIIYNKVENSLETIVKAGLSGKGTIRRELIDQLIPIYRHGKKWSYLITDYPTSIRDFQSLIMSLNEKGSKPPIKPNWHIKENEWVDRQRNLFVPPDGLSQHPSLEFAENDPKLLLAPTCFVKQGFDVVAQWDKDNINLGRKHLIKRRNEITNLLEKYSNWAKSSWTKLTTARQQNKMSPDLSKIFDLINSNFTGANIFDHMINQYKDINSFYSNYIAKPAVMPRSETITNEDIDEEDPLAEVSNVEIDIVTGEPTTDNNEMIDPKLYTLMKESGAAVAKIMDFIYSIGHYSSGVTYKRFLSDKPQGGRSAGQFQVMNDPTSFLVQYGVGHGTSSGIGRGGEIIISCKYAYRASWVNTAVAMREQVAARMTSINKGKQSFPKDIELVDIQKRIQIELGKKGYRNLPEGYQGAVINPVNAPNNLMSPEFTDTSGLIVQEEPKFWFGMSSTRYTGNGNIGRAVGRAEVDLNNVPKKVGQVFNSFTMCLDKLANIYPALRTDIWPLNAKMETLRNHVKEALENSRRKLAQEVELVFKTSDGRRDVLHQTSDSQDIIGKSNDIPETVSEAEENNEPIQTEPRYPSGDTSQPIIQPSNIVSEQEVVPTPPSVQQSNPVSNNVSTPDVHNEIPDNPKRISPNTPKKKSMEMEPEPPQKILTRERARSLGLKKRPISKGELEEKSVLMKIVEAANIADEKEMPEIADQLDVLAKLIVSF